MHQYRTMGFRVQHRGDDAGAGAGAAGKRLARASFPGADDDLPGVANLYEMDVRALWKRLVVFDGGTIARNRKTMQIIFVYHYMGVAHRDRSDLESTPLRF